MKCLFTLAVPKRLNYATVDEMDDKPTVIYVKQFTQRSLKYNRHLERTLIQSSNLTLGRAICRFLHNQSITSLIILKVNNVAYARTFSNVFMLLIFFRRMQ